MTAPMTHRLETPSEIRNGQRQFAYAARAHVGEFNAAKDPSRQIVRLMPKAKLSSLPLNQRAKAAVTATISDSAPIPKTSRPTAISQRCPDATVIAGPIKQRTAKIIKERLSPIRSIKTPPITTVKMFGKL